MFNKVDKTLERLQTLVKGSAPSVNLDGKVWYDITNQGLEAEVKALRVSGVIAHHPLIHALIRFEQYCV